MAWTDVASPILVVPVGASVEFANHDTLYHDIFSVSPAKPESRS